MNKKIVIDKLNITYQNKGKSLTALDNLSLTINKGEFVCILGRSGCGKTTLLNCLVGLIKPTVGSIKVFGKTAMVFQDSLLLPWRTVLQNAVYGLEIQHVPKIKAEQKARQTLQMLGLNGFENFYPSQLSGGMKQRVNLARALVCNPDILLMDEPFSHLDSKMRRQMQKELLNIYRKTKKTVIFVTHLQSEAKLLGKRLITLSPRPGKVIKDVRRNK